MALLTRLAASETLHRLNRLVPARPKLFAALAADTLGLRYTIVRIDPVSACNLRCQMCYFSDDSWRAQNTGKRLSESDLEWIGKQLFPQALQVHFGARMEPTSYRNYPSLVERAKQAGVPFVGFTTNAQILTLPNYLRMIEAGLDEITISTHGVRKETYQRLMRRASFARHHEALAMMREAHAALGRGPRIRVNYTVNPDNLDELQDFFAAYGSYPISTLQVRPIFDLGDTEYRNKTLALEDFRKATARLIETCRQRGVRLLINLNDPSYTKPNYDGYVHARAYLRLVGPEGVWPLDYDWRHETMVEYRARTHWRRNIAAEAFRARRRWPVAPSQSAASSVF